MEYHLGLEYDISLPDGISIMNPFKGNDRLLDICKGFYAKFYHDENPRFLILGINPGRLGAGATGIPFTDSKRLTEKCGLPDPGFVTHEPSSVFMYEMIDAFGGPQAFYQNFYINSVFPLGFIKKKNENAYVNYNYYDQKKLQDLVTPFVIEHIQKQIELVQRNDVAFCLGRGKNFAFLENLNKKHHFFEKIIPLDHPRYIMQYKSKALEEYILYYLNAFKPYTRQ